MVALKNLNFALMINKDSIFNLKTDDDFLQKALHIFNLQAKNNAVYRDFLNFLNIKTEKVTSLNQIPFLPISFFKSHKIVSNNHTIKEIFLSSGTTKQKLSKHYITNLSIYQQSYLNGFKSFYGNIKNYTILALLPNYLEQKNSSLAYMVNDLIKKTNTIHSGFYLNNLNELAKKIIWLENNNKKTLLIGVSFALLDLIKIHKFKLKNTIIMETGGMKGRKKEIIRASLHNKLINGFGVKKIHSEYGMTELLSQAYSSGNGIFNTPSWMKILIRDTKDSLTILPFQKTGLINIIDLANINSCSFIATQDLGKNYKNGDFEILGRFDNSDIRGCNLLVS